MAKRSNDELVEIVDPERVFYTLEVSEEEMKLLQEDHHIKSNTVSIRAFGYYLVERGEKAAHLEKLKGVHPVSFKTLEVEVRHVPSKR